MSEADNSLNNKAWTNLFAKHNALSRIENDGKFIISANEIKEEREPRLMAKFDHKKQLPAVFNAHNLAILPISRGEYVISHFEAYRNFDNAESRTANFSLPISIQSLNAENIPSESIAINCALASGILSDFLGEEKLYSTVSGRMGSGLFDFNIHNSLTNNPIAVSVSNSQIEIDAAFEGDSSLALLEAKLDLSDDFLVRQLYYPYRVWSSRISKKVRPVFLVYSNGIFSLYEYKFEDPNLYNSLVLVNYKQYSLEHIGIELSDLVELASSVRTIEEQRIPFPQADKFERVINLCELVNHQPLSHEDITEKYDFDARQTDYYANAARYLGFLEKEDNKKHGVKPVYVLSDIGKRIMTLNYRQRQIEFCRAIFQHSAFRDTFNLCIAKEMLPEIDDIVKIMQRSNLYNVNTTSTYKRRAQTIRNWIKWIIGLTDEKITGYETCT